MAAFFIRLDQKLSEESSNKRLTMGQRSALLSPVVLLSAKLGQFCSISLHFSASFSGLFVQGVRVLLRTTELLFFAALFGL